MKKHLSLISLFLCCFLIGCDNKPAEAHFTPVAVDLGLPSGTKWANCNVDATAPEEYGGYYAWGETEEKSDYSFETYKYCNYPPLRYTKYGISTYPGVADNKLTLDSEDDVAHVKWGGAWRMPTRTEQKELRNKCTWEWAVLNGVNGYRVTGPNGNSIFLPAAGYRHGSKISRQGSCGYYWSSRFNTAMFATDACYSVFSSSDFLWKYGNREYGNSVRPVCK